MLCARWVSVISSRPDLLVKWIFTGIPNHSERIVLMPDLSKILSFLAAARLPNLPGVACHVTTGALVSLWIAGAAKETTSIPWGSVCVAALAGVLLCVAGNLLNDWHDRDWDATYRPERALPLQQFAPGTFLYCGLCSAFVGIAAVSLFDIRAGWVALAIMSCIAIYTRFHKRTGWTVIPLAMCRGLLPLMGALAVRGDAGSPVVLGLCGSLFLWTCGLSLDARGESNGGRARSSVAWAILFAAPLLSTAVVRPLDPLPWTALAPSVLWLLMVRGPYRHTAKMRVSALLAGLPLLDFIVLATVWGGNPGLSSILLWIPFIAFGLGRLLQRVAAAT